MSLVVSIGGKIESYYSFKKSNIKPIVKTSEADIVNKHEENQESLDKKSPSNHKAKHIIQHSYGKQEEINHHRVKQVLARDIMSTPVHSVLKELSLNEALKKMNHLKCHHLLICEKELILGIISDRDLLKNSLTTESHSKKVMDVMTTEVILAKDDADIKILANIMLSENISSIPIVDESYHLEGIVTHKDLLRCLMNNMPLDVMV